MSDDKVIAIRRLYNEIIGFLQVENVLCKMSNIDNGTRKVQVLQDILWFTTCHQNRFTESGCKLNTFLHFLLHHIKFQETRRALNCNSPIETTYLWSTTAQ